MLPLAEVMEESLPAPWGPHLSLPCDMGPKLDDAQRRAAQLEYQLDLANARIHALHSTVAHLVSDDGLDQVLTNPRIGSKDCQRSRIRPGTRQPVFASRPPDPRNDYRGCGAARLGPGPHRTGPRLRVPRRRYRLDSSALWPTRCGAPREGRLPAFRAFKPRGLRPTCSNCPRFSDCARGCMAPVVDRRSAIGLSRSLAELESIELIADRVVEAVPEVIDCDRAGAVRLSSQPRRSRVLSRPTATRMM